MASVWRDSGKGEDFTVQTCAGKYESARKLMELVQHTESDAWLALSLATHLNMLPLSRQLSCITGYLWSRTLQACNPDSHPRLPSAWHDASVILVHPHCIVVWPVTTP